VFAKLLKITFLISVSWCVMVVSHETGHIIGGNCGGGTMIDADIRPWHLPYSIFDPDPHPLITLWSGLLLGVTFPLLLAIVGRRHELWFVAGFCMLANGLYIGTGWVAGDRYLDTTRLLDHGCSPILIALYCLLTIGFGYASFRRECLRIFAAENSQVSVSSTKQNQG